MGIDVNTIYINFLATLLMQVPVMHSTTYHFILLHKRLNTHMLSKSQKYMHTYIIIPTHRHTLHNYTHIHMYIHTCIDTILHIHTLCITHTLHARTHTHAHTGKLIQHMDNKICHFLHTLKISKPAISRIPIKVVPSRDILPRLLLMRCTIHLNIRSYNALANA